jgi:ribonuclease P protein component
MLKKVNRLPVFSLKNPKTISSKYFALKTCPNKMPVSRFGFVVSKKIDKRATARNRLKRKMRSCVEEIFDRIEVGWDFIFYAKKEGIVAERSLVLKEINDIFKKETYLR